MRRRILFDMQLLIWAAEDRVDLPDAVRELFLDAEVEPLFGAASIWEAAIKSALGRADFRVDPDALAQGLTEAGYVDLPAQSRHAAYMRALPFPGPEGHEDPFDRLLLAQARVEAIELATADRLRGRYGGGVLPPALRLPLPIPALPSPAGSASRTLRGTPPSSPASAARRASGSSARRR